MRSTSRRSRLRHITIIKTLHNIIIVIIIIIIIIIILFLLLLLLKRSVQAVDHTMIPCATPK
jgi:hypothetical protein